MKQDTILVADDDIFTLTSITSGLSDAGYQVVSAQDGKTAVQLGLLEQPDLALLDIRMPGMTGIEAARELKQRGNISTLFLSAYSDHDVVEVATREGALGYLVKPVNIQQLIPAIETALKRSAELQQLQKKESELLGAISRNREISVAVGIYMQRFAADEQNAFDAIRCFARSKSLKLANLATALVKESASRDDLIEAIFEHSLKTR
ncbi:ANTAR domain-containing response regulator [Sedimenticola selenatireducens]|uniref:Two-component system response regulator ZraR n=1 Tax=Sedimenticola selenatireducens TaxID=191960 RepID=A0A2N6CTH4_9GAMM|nr:response regulator [Sedimenticola selenatireducens]PLX60462.1 MAG: two-component system response regulator ZraR [Sedimenticola selenatireducens]